MKTREEAKKEYSRWLEKATADKDLIPELRALNPEEIYSAFCRDLEFGTGGLRGVIGAGTDRMNVYTVARASQGLSDYVNSRKNKKGRIAIGYDSRNKSRLFAETAAKVFAANGIEACIWPRLLPVPTLSFATRELGCDAGVMVTASHNPCEYNGYKVYGSDGCQLIGGAAAEVLGLIVNIDVFDGVKSVDFDKAVDAGKIRYIEEKVLDGFVSNVKAQSVLGADEKINRDIGIVYSPLHGTGLEPVTRVLRESGFSNITVVEEQRLPDGNFTTCPYPNPEIREALALGLEYAQRLGADLMLATDPDCDRVGIAVKNSAGEYVLLSGNQTGILLLDYICSRLTESGRMPENPLFIKTVVTSSLAEKLAADYGVRCVNVLTGFKYIGEQIALLEEKGKEDSYLLGYEESYGYLSGTYVRDKDGVNGAFLICEMFAYYKTQGILLTDRLEEIYGKYGYCLNDQQSYYFKGTEGFSKMKDLMANLRRGLSSIAGRRVVSVTDYLPGINGLPATDMLDFSLEDGSDVMVRPSGTEPKLKAYFTVYSKDDASACLVYDELRAAMAEIIK